MTTFLLVLLILGLIISITTNVFLIKSLRIQLNKIQTYQTWILDFKENVEETLSRMRAIDLKGTFAASLNDKGVFESDDEVGGTFKEMEILIEKLNQVSQ